MCHWHHDYAKCVRGWLLSCLNIPLVCVCHECAVCDTHCTLMTDTHKRYIHTTEQYCQAHTLSIDMTHTCDTSHMWPVCVIKWTRWTLAVVLPWWQHEKHYYYYYYYYYSVVLNNFSSFLIVPGVHDIKFRSMSHSLRALHSPYAFLVQLPYWVFVLFTGVHVTKVGGMLDAYCCSCFLQVFFSVDTVPRAPTTGITLVSTLRNLFSSFAR